MNGIMLDVDSELDFPIRVFVLQHEPLAALFIRVRRLQESSDDRPRIGSRERSANRQLTKFGKMVNSTPQCLLAM